MRTRTNPMIRMVVLSLALSAALDTPLDAEKLTRSQERDVAREIGKLRRENPELEVQVARSGLPKSIQGVDLTTAPPKSPESATAEEKVEAFLEEHGNPLFLLDKPAEETRIIDRSEDPAVPGQIIVKVQQQLAGIPVQGAEAVFVVDPLGESANIETTLTGTPEVATEPMISAVDAAGKASSAYREILAQVPELAADEAATLEEGDTSPAELIIVKPSDVGGEIREFRLTWKVRAGSFLFFVDALNGEILARYRDHHTVLARKTFDLESTQVFPGRLVLSDQPASLVAPVDEDAARAHEFAKQTYDFFFQMFGRDSFDDTDGGLGPKGGGVLTSFVRYGTVENAYWNRRKAATIYGPGFATALDVAAHEWTHAVTERQAGLVYQGESGALSEFFSDLFGAALDGDWIIGEDLPGFRPPSRPLRDMSDPHNGGFDRNQRFSSTNRGQPDHMSEAVRDTHLICASTLADAFNGCVHFNSGIWNKAAFLASEGGSHRGQTVVGIGREKVLRIFYATLHRLGSTAKFADTAQVVQEVCSSMAETASHGVTPTDCTELKKALQAVRVL